MIKSQQCKRNWHLNCIAYFSKDYVCECRCHNTTTKTEANVKAETGRKQQVEYNLTQSRSNEATSSDFGEKEDILSSPLAFLKAFPSLEGKVVNTGIYNRVEISFIEKSCIDKKTICEALNKVFNRLVQAEEDGARFDLQDIQTFVNLLQSELRL